MSFQGYRASIYTLGCRLNQADSALMADALRGNGFELVPWGEPADLVVIDSCTVTATATHQSGQALRGARRRCPEAFVVLTGCAATVEPERWQREAAADLILPNAAKTEIVRHLPAGLARPAQPLAAQAVERPGETLFTQPGRGLYAERTRANLKVQEGCDGFCSYCIVPHARGAPRSRAWDDALREAGELLACGHRELVLTGVNIAAYADHGRDLADLLGAVLALGDGFRLRLGSTEPGPVLPRIVDLMARAPRLCRSLHVPLQYAEAGILQAMNRRCGVREFAEFATQAVGRVPGVCLGSDIIVGFPGETEAIFEACYEALSALPLSYLHVFTYSPREGTPAARLPDRVDGRTAGTRQHRLSALSQAKSEAFARRSVGQILEVLTEQRNAAGRLEGWSDNYLRVEIADSDPPAERNQRVNVRITGPRAGHAVTGERVRTGPERRQP